MDDLFDCLIVGGGPAGLTAAIYLGRFRRKAMVFDTGASRAQWIPSSHNLPGFPHGLHGQDLLKRLEMQAAEYGVEIQRRRIDRVERDGDGFRLWSGPDRWRSRTALLATGVVETVPPVPGMAEAIRRGLVRVCPICDGFEVRDRRIGVLGWGDHAAREALFLRTYSADVTLVLTPEGTLGPDMQQALAEAGVSVCKAPLDALDLDASQVCVVRDGAGEPLRFDALYAAFGITPQVRMVRDLELPLDEDARVPVGDHQETATPGLFAAGDVVRGLNQICVAEGEAAIAACTIHNRLKAAERATPAPGTLAPRPPVSRPSPTQDASP